MNRFDWLAARHNDAQGVFTDFMFSEDYTNDKVSFKNEKTLFE